MPISTTYNPNSPSARTGQGSAIGNREDLSNEIYMLSPEVTPVFSLCTKRKATATFHEWNTNKLRAPRTTGAMEGADITTFEDKGAKKARLGNYIQIFQNPWQVSKTQAAVTSAGPAAIAEAEGNSLLELKRDIEASILSDNDRSSDNGSDTPYMLRGLGDWIDSSGPSDVPEDYRTPSGSILGAAPTEITFNDVISSIFSKTGKQGMFTLVAGIALRKRISQFTRTDNNASEGVYNVIQNAESKKVTLTVTQFEGDHGIVNIVDGNPDCMPADTRGYFAMPRYLGWASLINIGSQRLQDQGGGQRGFVDCQGTLEVLHPQAFGKIAY